MFYHVVTDDYPESSFTIGLYHGPYDVDIESIWSDACKKLNIDLDDLRYGTNKDLLDILDKIDSEFSNYELTRVSFKTSRVFIGI
ncbi:hypothetical protein Lepto7375DRAFT_7215 [Leptolyngbya sp. PCC 7375]|nr:hypothetical protein Lepto7375DRAFT_7215 [Leptolyngbya sp. PCC 7375]